MKTLILMTGLLSLLAGCGADVSSNHKQGTNKTPTTIIQGVSGSNESNEIIRSAIHREKGSVILSYKDEITKTFANDLSPALYRAIPLLNHDNEGSSSNVTTVAAIGRPTVTCGVTGTFTGIDARMNDCSQKNGSKAMWEGFRYGASGESTWVLVMRMDDGTEVWLDSRTGMVWSDIVKKDDGTKTFNWCKASGNLESGVGSVDCKAIGDLESLCEGASLYNLGTQVSWRLPTRNDFLQADLNGVRFVLKAETNSGLWTATMRAGATSFDEAWLYASKEGILSGAKLSEAHSVRCIGAPVR